MDLYDTSSKQDININELLIQEEYAWKDICTKVNEKTHKVGCKRELFHCLHEAGWPIWLI